MNNKVILISGASSGLGLYVSKYLAKKGYTVYGGYRDKHALQKVIPVKLDVTKDEDVENAVTFIINKEKRIDVLINIAGNTLNGPLADFSTNDFANLLDVNAVGAFRLIKKVYPMMRKQRVGKIINLTSLNGVVSLPNFSIYSASKHALQALSEAIYYEFLKDNIKVVTLVPGAIKSDKNNSEGLIKHKTVRSKFPILSIALKMTTQESIAKSIANIIESKNNNSIVIVGRDAKIVYLLKRYLPVKFWEKLMKFIWTR